MPCQVLVVHSFFVLTELETAETSNNIRATKLRSIGSKQAPAILIDRFQVSQLSWWRGARGHQRVDACHTRDMTIRMAMRTGVNTVGKLDKEYNQVQLEQELTNRMLSLRLAGE